jgi:hypothetical protein
MVPGPVCFHPSGDCALLGISQAAILRGRLPGFGWNTPISFGKKWNNRASDGLIARIIEQLEEDNLKKILIIGALAFAATSIAQTASAQEVYVVRDATTKKCTIVDTKPTTTTTTIVDNGTFKTRTEAETSMKTMKVCTTN